MSIADVSSVTDAGVSPAVGGALAAAPAAAPLAWAGAPEHVCFSGDGLKAVTRAIRSPVYILQGDSGVIGASLAPSAPGAGGSQYPMLGMLPPAYPEWLGDRAFGDIHNVRFPYIVGEMAHGIASPQMVIAAARAGMLGFLGAAGLTATSVAEKASEVAAALDPEGLPWGVNLIHSPNEPGLEMELAELYIGRGLRNVSASAFMSITPAIAYLAAKGLRVDQAGAIHRPRSIFAKISRPEMARLFMSPPPQPIVDALVADGKLSAEEARLAALVPVAEDITVEADSGGHTDGRPSLVSTPRISGLRDEIVRDMGYQRPIRVGAAGGIGTPAAAAAAFGLGADYLVTGSVNQACVESGLSAGAREMLEAVDMADVAMAASADMFELGVKVQVLKRGVMFASRANLLYSLYTQYNSLAEIPADRRAAIERDIFKAPLEDIWAQTKSYFSERNPAENERAARDEKHRMALVFRWYLGNSIRWAIRGQSERRLDYQIWCGPAMGAFNAWTAGTFLASASARTVGQVGRNILEGAAVISRAHALRQLGLAVPASCFQFAPTDLS
ncbi:MAG: PfaD family polyunsaturated fatty acid/polyketide biosynthesis protein [Pseudomonadota bacterium]